MKSSKQSTHSLTDRHAEQGRAIARAMQEVQVEKQKNMAKAERRKATMLENAAEQVLSGTLSRI